MELKWIASASAVESSNLFFETFDISSYTDYATKFVELSNEEKIKYKNIDGFFLDKTGIEMNHNKKNYKKLCEEININLLSKKYYDILFIDRYSEKDTVMDLLASLENENYIKKIYKQKKQIVKNDLKSDTAIKLMNSICQGRSLLQSAQSANMLSKPLIDFYAASAYAYATIVINSPLHKSFDSLKGSHGHTYNHKNGTIDFGGTVPFGTFTDLLASSYLIQIVTTDNVRLKYDVLKSLDFVQKHAISISLLALLSSVPELRNQVCLVNSKCNIVWNLNVERTVDKKDNFIYKFEIGDGKNLPNENVVKSVFNVETIKKIYGKYIVEVSAEDVGKICPTIYQDIYGKLWYVEPLIENLYLPEICLHFLIISALCNIMRYSPYEWNNILSNKISSEFSLLISKYLRLFELKYPMLLTEQLTNLLPIISSK